jgi:prepilin-type processing-associated H-X9-DG protein
MDIKLQLKETIRFMLLPVPGEREEDCINALIGVLQESQVEESSYMEFLRLKHDIWMSESKLDPVLKKAINAVLEASNPEFGQLFAMKYFDLHSSLISNPFISPELSIIVLSHLRLITNLADHEKMSAAKITKVLQSADSRLSVISWKQLSTMLRQLGKLPQFKQDEVEALYVVDERLQVEYFADAGLNEAIAQIGEVAKSLQFTGDAGKLLDVMSKPGNVHLPYLQILHYQCLISGFYDHVLSTPYEFNPRGQIANWLFRKWDGLLHTSNPILNNAKAVDVLDENWARSRNSNEYEQASALVEVFKGIDGMGFAAAQELTSWIRRWLVRYITSESATIVRLADVSANDAIKVLEHIGAGPTATYGILEQRYMDVLAASLHKKEDGWRSRGISDAVNSNNLSKRKLGDCDFQHVESKTITAYEAHGGTLNRIYFDGHVRTFRRALQRRREELETIADIDQWHFKVTFVAYGFTADMPDHFIVDGLRVETAFITFKDLLENTDTTSTSFNSGFNSLFIDILNDRRTPAAVREKIRTLLHAETSI